MQITTIILQCYNDEKYQGFIMSVKTKHPQYTEFAPIVKLTRDAVKGNPAIKAAGTTYLPADFSDSDEDRYNVYKERAYFMGVTGQTQDASIGMVFRKPAIIGLSSPLQALSQNIDGSGQSLDQIARYGVKEVEEAGRIGFLADYPTSEEGITKAEETALGLRPYMSTYAFESIINWKTEVVGGKDTLTMVVLKESIQDPSNTDEFDHEVDDRYRVLRLVQGVYTQQIYNDAGVAINEQWIPKQSGKPINYIPFYFAGAANNLPSCDMPMLYDIAVVNIAHYQTTADHRENLFVHGQLTMGISTDLSHAEFEAANSNGVTVGAREGIFLGESGSLQSITAPESGALRVALLDLLDEMRDLGAKKVQAGGQAETAEAARINASAQTSTLSTVAMNVSEAMTKCLIDMSLFMGANDDVSYTLNQDFWEASLDPQLISAVTNLKLNGTIATTDVLYMIRQGRIGVDPDRTDEQIAIDVANELIDG